MKRGLEAKMHHVDSLAKVFDFVMSDSGGGSLDGGGSDSSDEFYNSPAPSEDIWKKFELLPTPPRSPTRDPIDDDLLLLSNAIHSPAEQLSLVSDLLDVDDNNPNSVHHVVSCALPWPGKLLAGLKWDLLHDCMWSGQCTDSCKQKNAAFFNPLPTLSVADVTSVLTGGLDCRPETPVSGTRTATPSGGVPISPLASPLSMLMTPHSDVVAECSSVPYTPLSDHSYHQANVVADIKQEVVAMTPAPSPAPLIKEELLEEEDEEAIGDYCDIVASSDDEEDQDEPEVAALTSQQESPAHFKVNNIALSDTPSDSDDEIDVVTVTSTGPSALYQSCVQRVFLNPAIRNLPVDGSSAVSSRKTSRSNSTLLKPRLNRGRPSKASLAQQRASLARAESPIEEEEDDDDDDDDDDDSSSSSRPSSDLWQTDLIATATTTTSNRNQGNANNNGRKRNAEEKAANNVARKYRRFKKTPSSRSRFPSSSNNNNSSSNHNNNNSRSSSDSEDVEKRSMHNSMERKRRDDLRFAFQTLRETVPDLRDKPKAPKVLILNKAAVYAKQLSNAGAILERTLKIEARKRLELQRRLQQLRHH